MDTEHGTAHAARVPGNQVVPGFPKQRNPVGVALVEKLLGDGIGQFDLAGEVVVKALLPHFKPCGYGPERDFSSPCSSNTAMAAAMIDGLVIRGGYGISPEYALEHQNYR